MEDAWYHILSKLPLSEKVRLERVSKQWKAMLNLQLRCAETIDTADFQDTVSAHKLTRCLLALLDRCSRRVRSFRFREYRCLEVDEKLMDKLFAKCGCLRTFEIKNAFITHEALSLFNQMPSEIEEFRLDYCILDTRNPEITRYSIKQMLHRCLALRQFSILGIGSSFGYLVIDDDLLRHLPKNVEILSASAGDSLRLETVEFSKRLPRLEAFEVQHCPLPNGSLRQLAINCPSLIHLDISYSSCLSDFSPILTLKLLKELHLKATQVNDQHLALIITHCLELERLNLSSCRLLTETGLRVLRRSKTMKVLDISAITAVTDSVISDIVSGCLALQDLNFNYCPKVSFNAVRSLALMPKLQRVW